MDREGPLRIGLSARLMHAPPAELGFRDKVLQYLEQSAAHWIMAHGALAFMVPTLYKASEIERHSLSVRDYVGVLDGLLLQGGSDVSPASYGETPLHPDWAGDRVRDLYEIELMWEFVFHGKPVLGICRGAQLINVALGGSLIQDIPSLHEGAIVHRDETLYDKLHHDIRFVPGARLVRLYPDLLAPRVSSIHHQAVLRLGHDLDIEAEAPDGIVEAIRWRGKGYLAGFQWHPEFHTVGSAALDSGPIIQEFLEAATRARQGAA